MRQDIVQLPAQAAFPKAARLLKTDEFSSVFRLRPWRRSPHFVLYGKPSGMQARLGLVIGKKQAPRAVTRNLIKRLAREAFRLRRGQLNGFDILIRLHMKIDRKAMPSASSPPLRALIGGELEALLDRAVREALRRSAEPVAAPHAPAVDETPGPSGS
ncbi:ribonuclease P protein component [Caballeronia cordobensis]|uniref:ribonuclease P protein component n=1 Tax=Caballeronia cordobensis TaxID=1353886 RepID=UPI0002388558|nr:ribonuclease P protein component [Burkholderia sp. YI23]AQH00062.1 ribonuclease P protein component [Burkholderia sp. KK1]